MMQNHVGVLHHHQVGELYTEWDPAAVAKLKTEGLLPPLGTGETDESDEYDHNLEFMDRQPAWAPTGSDKAKAAMEAAVRAELESMKK